MTGEERQRRPQSEGISRWAIRLLALGLALPAGTSFSRAQELVVQASVNANPVGVGQEFTLLVEVAGAGSRRASEPDLPDISDFAAFLGSGSSQRFEWVNGRTSASILYEYRFEATKEGSFQVDAVSVELDGRTYQTKPISLRVAKTQPSSARRGDTSGTQSAVSQEELFVKGEADRRQVLPNQPVVVEWKIYTLVHVRSYSISTPPETQGFWAEDFDLPDSPRVRTEMLGGRRYTVATIKKTALYPSSPGEKAIGPMRLETEVQVRSQRRRDPFGDLFGDSLLFGRRSLPVRIASDPIRIEVMPFPEQGKPEDFTGFTGELDLTATLDRQQTEVNTPVTLTIAVKGEGNLKILPEPGFDLSSDFEVYHPKISERSSWEGDRLLGTKTYEYVLIPRSPGVKSIPGVSYSYFDPSRRGYRRAANAPLTLRVEGGDEMAFPTFPRRRGAVVQLAQDIRFLKSEIGGLQPVGQAFYQSLGLWLILLAPMLAMAAAVGYRRHQDRLSADVAYARHRRASRLARTRLAKARSLLSVDTWQDFYAEAGKALSGYLGDQLNIAEAGLISREAEARLSQRGVSEEAVQAYFQCLQVCDLKRFSPTESDLEEMSAFLASAEDALSRLGREIKG